ncbi:MAG: phage major capsid protein [Pseudobacteriovorax sp.]|nr:phage major capsid protein [Pseudobacteriovorax sp.]
MRKDSLKGKLHSRDGAQPSAMERRRFFEITDRGSTLDLDLEKREVTFPFSSSYEADRGWFKETVDQTGVDLRRLQDGGALLLCHDRNQQIGKTLRSWMGDDGRLYTRVKFSRSGLAENVFQDVIDGIRRNVSFSYRVKDFREDGEDERGVMRVTVTQCEAMEVSIEPIPADPTVGMNRSQVKNIAQKTNISKQPSSEGDDDVKRNQIMKRDGAGASSGVGGGSLQGAGADGGQAGTPSSSGLDQDEVLEIISLGSEHNRMDLAKDIIARGGSASDMARAVLKNISTNAHITPPVNDDIGTGSLAGLTTREAANFSIFNAVKAEATRNWDDYGHERDIILAAKKRTNQNQEGIPIPKEVLYTAWGRNLEGVSTTAQDSIGPAIRTNLMSYIETLEANTVVKQAGATTITGIQGNLEMPRGTNSVRATWVAEGGETTKTKLLHDKVRLIPNGLRSEVELTRLSLNQASVAMEPIIRRQMALKHALATDHAIFFGDGQDKPLGITKNPRVRRLRLGREDGGGELDWPAVVRMQTAVRSANAAGSQLAYITTPAVAGALKTTEKATNTAQFIMMEDDRLNGKPAYDTTNIEETNLEGNRISAFETMIYGNWSSVIIGEFGDMYILVDPYSGSNRDLISIKGTMYVDMDLEHPESFTYYNDIIVPGNTVEVDDPDPEPEPEPEPES